LGRREQLGHLFKSLAAQTMKDFEVILVDQNYGDFLKQIVEGADWPFPLRHIRTPGEHGLSRGRNRGWPGARGDVILFPDDDCWYPPDLFERALELMERRSADILTGRATDLAGRSINGRYERRPTKVTRHNAFTTQIEWIVFFRRAALEAVGGYDPTIGIGADTPWQSCEGPDIVLRALRAGMTVWFDPAIVGHHEELNVVSPDAAMRAKGRAYGRGFGFVLRKHGYGLRDGAYWVARSALNTSRSFVRGEMDQARYYAGVTLGRLEGYLRWTLGAAGRQEWPANPQGEFRAERHVRQI
jgi:glycosyltransferase involved in cell wall biosynthesis